METATIFYMRKLGRTRIGDSEMPSEGAIIFRDLVGKLEVLNIECDKCHSRRVVQDSVDGTATDGGGDGALGGMY